MRSWMKTHKMIGAVLGTAAGLVILWVAFLLFLLVMDSVKVAQERAISPRHRFAGLLVTPQLAAHLRDCTPATYTSRDTVLHNWWLGRSMLSGGSLSIQKPSADTCQLIFKGGKWPLFKSDTPHYVTVPLGLVRKVGEVYLSTFEDSPQHKQMRQTFAQCVAPQKAQFNAQNPALNELQEIDLWGYLSQWDGAQIQTLLKRNEQGVKTCSQMKVIFEQVLATPGYAALPRKEQSQRIAQTLQSHGCRVRLKADYPDHSQYNIYCEDPRYTCSVTLKGEQVVSHTVDDTQRPPLPPVCW